MTLGSFNQQAGQFDNQQRLHSALPAVNNKGIQGIPNQLAMQQARNSGGFPFDQMTQGSSAGYDPNM